MAAAVAITRGTSNTPTSSASRGLPDTPDYHSLAIDPENEQVILLGTHQGLYRSRDGGATWRAVGLAGQDAMNLARPARNTLWVAGHDVLEKSTDGGQSWLAVSPRGLPSLDVHGFAVDPRDPRTLYAAVAGQGLYRSTNNGVSFQGISSVVGGDVMALAATPARELFAGDMQRGLLKSGDGGRTWRAVVHAQLMGLAVDPRDPRRILATGPGILLSTDGGRTWRQRLRIDAGAGPVAWAPSKPRIAYVVGFDRQLYRTTDGGDSWRVVR